MSSNPNSGILTFLFTDLEDSTRLWEQYPDAMRPALERHDTLLKRVVENHKGWIVKTTGDGFHAAFESPADGVAAALESQQTVASETWPDETGPLKIRIGLHTGESQERDGDYYGPEVNLAARVMNLGYGGQVLLSGITAELTRKFLPQACTLSDLGEHRIKGIASPERIFQLSHPDLITAFPPLKSLDTYKHNLNRQLSNFIGREKELEEVRGYLDHTRLLTLLGPGGTGKTRLMLRVAEDVIEDYPHGVWLVELAPLTNPDLIPERVAAALNVQEQPGRQILDTLIEYLRRKELLLLLDNVEHMVQESAEFVEHTLGHCHRLKILVTGREALFILGETTIQVPSLSLPGGNQSLDAIAASEGVQLFLERAHAVRPGFRLTEQNADTLVEVVQRLDGIPLALELAAARLRMLTIKQINARLNDRFRLLTGGSRTALPRQQTLQALIDWSWRLLNEKERILLRRLSVFSGGWNLESAQAVTGFDPLDELDVFDLLEQLINKSLVWVEYPPGSEARYSMLESIRQFSRDKLFDAGEGEILRNRYADYFVSFSLEAEKHMRLSTMLLWEERVVQELDNIRSVLTWTQEERPEIALRITAALLYNWAFWIHPSEALKWLETAIERTRSLINQPNSGTQTRDFIKALHGMGFIQALLGKNKTAIETLNEAIRLADDHGELQHYLQGIAQKTSTLTLHWHDIPTDWIQTVDAAIDVSQEKGFDWERASLHFAMLSFHTRRGSFEQAIPHFKQAETLILKFNNPRNLGLLFIFKALMAISQGDSETAQYHYEQAVEEFAAMNNQRIELIIKSDLSHLLRRSGKINEALPLYQETILRWQEQGNPVAVAHQLECFAFLAIMEGQFENAARLLGIAAETRVQLDEVTTDPQEIAEMEQAMGELAEAMGETERERVIAEGAEMSLDDAVLLALNKLNLSKS